VSDRLDKIAQAGEIMRQSDIRLGMDVERARIVSIIKPLGCQAITGSSTTVTCHYTAGALTTLLR
jgi:hypothetical protein